MTNKTKEERSFLAPSRWILILLVMLLFGLGLAIRLYDITDLPLDFHPTRQLFSALKARGMYYQTLPDIPEWQRDMALNQWKTKVTVEPPLLEILAVATYRFTGENLWVARIYSIIFWLAGGVFLFSLAKELTSRDGALAALAFYLFLPYGIFASRSFQPDPLMVTLILVFWRLIYRWSKQPAWKWAILAGLIGGIAILVKLVAVFFVIGGALGALLGRHRVRELASKPQVWSVIGLGILPGAVYVIYGVLISGALTQQFSGRFMPALLISPAFYLNWAGMIDNVTGHMLFVLGLLGALFFISREKRIFALGIWTAYFFYGLFFNYHISSHDYYSLPLIPIVALSLAPLADKMLGTLLDVTRGARFLRVVALISIAYLLTLTLWDARSEMKSVDYRPQAEMWAEIGEIFDHRGGGVIALTDDYGSRMAYWGWQSGSLWPTYANQQYSILRSGQNDFDQNFEKQIGDRSFFLLTKMDELDYQPYLKEKLFSYQIYAEGNGYIIFDLSQPVN